MNPTLEQLAQYIMKERQKGVPDATIRSVLLQSGWTEAWLNTAFQTVQQPILPRPAQPEDEVLHEAPRSSRTKQIIRLLSVLLLLVAIGGGAYFITSSFRLAADQKVARDAARRSNLATLLNKLSDYYVVHTSYPTNTEMNNPTFLKDQGIDANAIRDPKWSADNPECSRDGKPIFAIEPAERCYAYSAVATNEGACNNKDVACSKMKISIFLEKDKAPYIVVFDQNSEVGE